MTLVYHVNEYITLKLENGMTNIYVNDKLFNHCKYVLLNLKVNEFEDYESIDSIDDALEIYSRKHESDKTVISKETEFFAHCSNLQAWVENDYHLGILHSSLSFPLLSRLVQVGDEKARIIMKEEILLRISSKDEKVIHYFLNENHLNLFTYEELQLVFDEIDIENQNLLRRINNLMNRKYIIEKLKKKRHLNIDVRTRSAKSVY